MTGMENHSLPQFLAFITFDCLLVFCILSVPHLRLSYCVYITFFCVCSNVVEHSRLCIYYIQRLCYAHWPSSFDKDTSTLLALKATASRRCRRIYHTCHTPGRITSRSTHISPRVIKKSSGKPTFSTGRETLHYHPSKKIAISRPVLLTNVSHDWLCCTIIYNVAPDCTIL